MLYKFLSFILFHTYLLNLSQHYYGDVDIMYIVYFHTCCKIAAAFILFYVIADIHRCAVSVAIYFILHKSQLKTYWVQYRDSLYLKEYTDCSSVAGSCWWSDMWPNADSVECRVLLTDSDVTVGWWSCHTETVLLVMCRCERLVYKITFEIVTLQ